jgi:predicted AAA+ superfamily ATPase
LKCHQLKKLKQWLQKSNRKPLIIRGARQVGKSTLVQLFSDLLPGKQPLSVVNLERHYELNSTFASKDPQKIINIL